MLYGTEIGAPASWRHMHSISEGWFKYQIFHFLFNFLLTHLEKQWQMIWVPESLPLGLSFGLLASECSRCNYCRCLVSKQKIKDSFSLTLHHSLSPVPYSLSFLEINKSLKTFIVIKKCKIICLWKEAMEELTLFSFNILEIFLCIIEWNHFEKAHWWYMIMKGSRDFMLTSAMGVVQLRGTALVLGEWSSLEDSTNCVKRVSWPAQALDLGDSNIKIFSLGRLYNTLVI